MCTLISQYHQYQGSIGCGIRLDEYIKKLYCDDTHITLKLRRALALLIFGHYGTEMYIDSVANTPEIQLETFKKRVLDKVKHCKEALANRKRDMPVDDPYVDEDFTNLELTRKTEWTREELLPSPSLFTSLKLKLKDGTFLLFDTLSSGEKQIIYTLGTTVYQLHHLNSVDASKIQYPCVNIIFDEIEPVPIRGDTIPSWYLAFRSSRFFLYEAISYADKVESMDAKVRNFF